ncbi:TPA: RNA-binding protein, partial [Enterococcus faecalis]
MNKQEKEDLIQALYDIGGCDAEDEWSRGYDDGVNASIEVVKELKVQGKVVLPKSADEFIKEGLSMGSDKVDIIDSAVSFSSTMPTAEFSMWFKTNGDLLIDALA